MKQVRSSGGTIIGFSKSGSGPPLRRTASASEVDIPFSNTTLETPTDRPGHPLTVAPPPCRAPG